MHNESKMPDRLRRSSLVSLVFVILFSVDAYAETFEFLSYSPPRGWIKQVMSDGITYRRASGVGLIYFYASYPSTDSASDEFAKMWRARIEPTVPGSAPLPLVQRDGDYAVAVGSKRVDAQGTITTVAFVAIVGRGRAIGVTTLTAGDDALAEVTTFLDTVTADPKAAKASPLGPGTGEMAVDFDVPAGYVLRREGGSVLLVPAAPSEQTPCAYGVSPPRPSSGALDRDARSAIADVMPGWQVKNENFNAMRGTSAAGWPYYWFRTDLQRLVGASYEYASVMTMAFAAERGQVNVVWGAGNPARCLLDDIHFSRLFHSLRPRGWNTDGGKALARELHGTWRNSQRLGMAQYKFLPGGRYEFGIGTVTRMGLFERTSSSVSDGRWELRDGELVITPDRRDRGTTRYRVRIYDEFVGGRWTRAMSLLDENAKPALEVQYMRIEN